MMKIYAALLFFIILSCCSCSKDKLIADEYESFTYAQTKCNDAWATGTTDSLTLVNVAAYLTAEDLYIASLIISQTTTADTCTACSCKTGKVINLSTLKSAQHDKYVALGFRPQ